MCACRYVIGFSLAICISGYGSKSPRLVWGKIPAYTHAWKLVRLPAFGRCGVFNLSESLKVEDNPALKGVPLCQLIIIIHVMSLLVFRLFVVLSPELFLRVSLPVFVFFDYSAAPAACSYSCSFALLALKATIVLIGFVIIVFATSTYN